MTSADPLERLASLGLSLPEPAAPVASYVPAVRSGNLLFVSGQLPMVGGELTVRGRLGADVDLAQGRAAARTCAVNVLAAAHAAVGLDRVGRIVRLTGYVASAEHFTDQPAVLNGASDLMVEVFGEAGRHARSAVGVGALPLGAPVEVEAVIELDDGPDGD